MRGLRGVLGKGGMPVIVPHLDLSLPAEGRIGALRVLAPLQRERRMTCYAQLTERELTDGDLFCRPDGRDRIKYKSLAARRIIRLLGSWNMGAEPVTVNLDEIKRLLNVIEYEPFKNEALFDGVISLSIAGQLEIAERVIELITDDSKKNDLLKRITTGYLRSEKWETAERVIQLITDNSSKNKLLKSIAIVYLKSKQWVDAERVIESITDDSIKNIYLKRIIDAYIKLENFEKANAIACTITDAAIKDRVKNKLLMIFAEACIISGKLGKAEAALRWMTNNVTKKIIRVQICIKLNKLQEAEKIVNSFSSNKKQIYWLLKIAQAYFCNNNLEQAERLVNSIDTVPVPFYKRSVLVKFLNTYLENGNLECAEKMVQWISVGNKCRYYKDIILKHLEKGNFHKASELADKIVDPVVKRDVLSEMMLFKGSE